MEEKSLLSMELKVFPWGANSFNANSFFSVAILNCSDKERGKHLTFAGHLSATFLGKRFHQISVSRVYVTLNLA